MATKADFTAEEWQSLQQGVTDAGLSVSLSDRTFFGYRGRAFVQA